VAADLGVEQDETKVIVSAGGIAAVIEPTLVGEGRAQWRGTGGTQTKQGEAQDND
jgi:hypothetical protein